MNFMQKPLRFAGLHDKKGMNEALFILAAKL
jgi:hypothetical protein